MSTPLTFEVCVETLYGALAAQSGGAHRIELCANLADGGTTPSLGMVETCLKHCPLDIMMMIRPRGGNFVYSDLEIEVMRRDIGYAKVLGVKGVVLGILDNNNQVDIARSTELIKWARPLTVCFHRAFDLTADPKKALEDVITCGADRLLTSGQREKAWEGRNLIQKLIAQAGNRISVMPGSGINEENIQDLLQETGANEFHASAREEIHIHENAISMGSGDSGSRLETSPKKSPDYSESCPKLKSDISWIPMC